MSQRAKQSFTLYAPLGRAAPGRREDILRRANTLAQPVTTEGPKKADPLHSRALCGEILLCLYRKHDRDSMDCFFGRMSPAQSLLLLYGPRGGSSGPTAAPELGR